MRSEMFQCCLYFTLFFICSVVPFVHSQVNSELDKPYVTKDGVLYRDVLTVASAKGVAQFAKSYQRQQHGLAIYNERISKAKGSQTPRYTTFDVGYDPSSLAAAIDNRFPGLDFRASRRLRRFYVTHQRERSKADQDEAKMIIESRRREYLDAIPRRKKISAISNRRSNTKRLRSWFERTRSKTKMVDHQRYSTSLPARNKFTLKPRNSNRFLPLTTRIQESGPVIDPSYFPEFRESNVERYKDIVSNQAILPVEDYCDITEPSNYLYQLDLPECHLVDSVPAATPLFPDDPKLELSQMYESVPVNYEYEIGHFY